MKSNFSFEGSHIRQLKLLHHALRLPLALYRGSAIVFVLPKESEDYRWAVERTEVIDALALRLQTSKAAYIQGSISRGYIGLRQDEDHILLVGPIIKTALVATTDKATGLHSANSIPVSLNADSIFYIVNLLEEYFSHLSSTTSDAAEFDKDLKHDGTINESANRDSMSSFFTHPPYFLEQELALAIQQGSTNAALDTLQEINSLQRAQVAVEPLRSLKNSLIGSCALCSRAAISGGMTADAAFSLADAYIRSIEKCQQLKELSQLEEEMVLCFSKRVESLRRGEISNLILSAMRYIDEYLSEKLRLPDIAAQVFIHPDYLSALFKKETGETITRYIQKRRIQEACRFLRYSHYPIAEIAEYFQFSSQSAFTKIFKQFENLTPKQYRDHSPPLG
ncbi:MAG: helix-turn-helix domain-containing protein [Clostridiales bacterium]|nr:helix-turn-helix domain-containing protein [Clostridiales bacterium]